MERVARGLRVSPWAGIQHTMKERAERTSESANQQEVLCVGLLWLLVLHYCPSEWGGRGQGQRVRGKDHLRTY